VFFRNRSAPACQGNRFEPEFGSDRPHLGNTGWNGVSMNLQINVIRIAAVALLLTSVHIGGAQAAGGGPGSAPPANVSGGGPGTAPPANQSGVGTGSGGVGSAPPVVTQGAGNRRPSWHCPPPGQLRACYFG
jgi:hypothetical protein